MGVGKQIRKYRQQLGLTLEQLCQLSGVEPGTISALENRNSSRSAYLPALARALGLSLEQLADESKTYAARPTPAGKQTGGMLEQEPAVPYGWPFKSIEPSQWLLLSDAQRAHIEEGIRLLVPTIPGRSATKHREPAYKKSAA